MKILGVDPGTHRLGFGVIETGSQKHVLIESGLLSGSQSGGEFSFAEIKSGIDRVISQHKPQVMAIEQLYFAKNQKTALRVAEARGVVLLSAHEHKIPVREFTPNEIKLGITGYGLADKRAVAKMVKLMLSRQDLSVIDDVTDALAVALLAGQIMKNNYPQLG